MEIRWKFFLSVILRSFRHLGQKKQFAIELLKSAQLYYRFLKSLVVYLSLGMGVFFLSSCEKCKCNPGAPKLYLYLYSVDQSGVEERIRYTEMIMPGVRRKYRNDNQLPLNGGGTQNTFYIKYNNAQIDTLTISYRIKFVEMSCGMNYEIVDTKIIEPTTFDNAYINGLVYVQINN